MKSSTVDKRSQSSTTRQSVYATILPLLASVTGVFVFVALCIRAYHVKCPIWFDGPVLGIHEAIRTGQLYQAEALTRPPYFIVTHPPLSYMLGYPIYMAGGGAAGLRLLNVLLILACALVVYLLARDHNGRGIQTSAIFASTVFLAFPPVFRWSQLIRCPDALSCFFDLLVVLLLMRYPKNPTREVLAGLLFFLAILSKQTAILTFGPVFLWEARRSQQPTRLTSIRLAAVVLPTAIFIAGMQWSTHGGFITNVIEANMMGPNYYTWIGDIVIELRFFWLFALIVLYLAKQAHLLIRLWFLVSALVGIFTDWKDGANSLYFFEASATLAILAGSSLRSIAHSGPVKSWMKSTLLAAPIVLIVFVSDAYAWSMSDRRNENEYSKLLTFIQQRKTPGRKLLTQDISESLALHEEPVWNDALVFGALAEHGRWDDRYIASELHQRHYYAVVSMVDHFWTASMKKELAEQYRVAAVFGGTFLHTVYVPIDRNSSAQ